MINRLRIIPTKIRIPEGNGDNIGIGVLASGDMIVTDFGRTKGQRYVRTTPATPVRTLTASATLTASQVDGLTVVFDSATIILATLPLASTCKGARVRGVWKTLVAGVSATDGHAFRPATGDFIGAGVTALTSVVSKDVVSAANTDAVTDRIELTSNGSTGWVITDFVGAFTKQA